MCCPLQRQQTYTQYTHPVTGEERCSWRSYKVTIGVGAIFAVATVVGLFWGGIELVGAAETQDPAVFKEGLIILGGTAVSAVISTVAFTRLCIANISEEEVPQQVIVV